MRVILSFVLFICFTANSSDRFTNYLSSIEVNDFVINSDTLIAATSGGLYQATFSGNYKKQISDSKILADIQLTSLCKDQNGNVWIGSKKGYLYKKTPNNIFHTYSSYVSSGWDIKDINIYNGLLLIGSSKGLSVFDPNFNNGQGSALNNVQKFGEDNLVDVNKIFIYNNELYVGCQNGYAKLNNSSRNNLERGALSSKSNWTTVKTTSSILDFTIESNNVVALSNIQIQFKNRTVSANGTTVLIDKQPHIDLPESGKIVSFTSTDRYCLIGTSTGYFYIWDDFGNRPVQQIIKGLTSTDFNKILATKNGKVWSIPTIDDNNFYAGIHHFDGFNWQSFNKNNLGFNVIGSMGGTSQTKAGLCESSDGQMWFGPWFGNIKQFNPEKNQWKLFYIGHFGAVKDFRILPLGTSWYYDSLSFKGKCDAIAEDSLGFMWFGAWDNPHGSIVAYDKKYEPDPSQSDPYKAHYIRLFKEDSDYHMENPSSINVNMNNTIFIGSDINFQKKNGGSLIVLRYTNSILDSNFQVELYTNLKSVWDMTTTPDNTTYIVTPDGLRSYSNFTLRDPILTNYKTLRCVEWETDSILWLGTSDQGLFRYDLKSREMKVFTRDQGLPSNFINDLSIDRAKKILWIATNNGISNYPLERIYVKNNENKKVVVYPNPYSISKANQPFLQGIKFYNLNLRSIVKIYTLDGTLIFKQQPKNSDGLWSVNWEPPQNTTPGTYIYTVTQNKSSDNTPTSTQSISNYNNSDSTLTSTQTLSNYKGKLLLIP